MEKCPFCGAAKKLPYICPTCKHTDDYVFGNKWECGTWDDEDDDGLQFYRHTNCYEAQLAQQAELLRRAEEVVREVSEGNTFLNIETGGDLVGVYKDVQTKAQALLPEIKKALEKVK